MAPSSTAWRMSYTSAYSPKTWIVFLSSRSSGVPVKPTKVALGSASRIQRAPPSTKPYWLRCASSAITTTLERSEITPCASANFWIVVNTTPPPARSSSSLQVLPALGLYRRLPQQGASGGEGVEELVVEVVAVGDHDDGRVGQARLTDQRAGQHQHGQRLARALGVPDHAAATVARPGGWLEPRQHAARAPCAPRGTGGSRRSS